MREQFIFGLHSVEALLRTHPKRAHRLCLLKARQDKKIEMIAELAKTSAIPIKYYSKSELDLMVDDANHQGVIAFCDSQTIYSEADLPHILQNKQTPPFLLLLDGVQDPHNLGACFRTADAAGVDAIIVPKDNAVGITPVVSRVASGATETVPFVQVTNLSRTMKTLKDLGVWIYGASGEAKQSLFKTDLRGPLAIVLGAEGSGLRRLTKEHCDVLVNIPLFGSVSSLNVSVAAGVFLFEVVRHRISITYR